jgi:hypothetical protein
MCDCTCKCKEEWEKDKEEEKKRIENMERGEAFIYGANARRYGHTLEMCPFPEGTRANLGWIDGWHYEKANQEKIWRKKFESLTNKSEKKPNIFTKIFNFLFKR